MVKKIILSAGLVAAAGMLAGAGTTLGKTVETLHVGAVPTATVTDPTPLGYGSSFTLNFIGNAAAQSTALLALMIPGNSAAFTDTFDVTTTVGSATYDGSATFNGGLNNANLSPFNLNDTASNPNASGYWGDLTASSGALSTILGGSFSASESATNFFGFDNNAPTNTEQWGIGLNTTEFGVYTVLVTLGTGSNITLKSGDQVTISPGTNLPLGSIIAAMTYTYDTKKNSYTYYTTAWTNTGGINDSNPTPLGGNNSPTPAPIPATLPLLGGGLLGLGLIALRKRRLSSQSV